MRAARRVVRPRKERSRRHTPPANHLASGQIWVCLCYRLYQVEGWIDLIVSIARAVCRLLGLPHAILAQSQWYP